MLLERLEGLKELRGGERWTARCPGPNHANGDKRPSLAVARGDDRWLIHCYAGCYPVDIMRALGLELQHLFDDRKYKPRGDRQRPRLSAAERFELVEHEVLVAHLLVSDFLRTKTMSEADYSRLTQAASRIGSARNA